MGAVLVSAAVPSVLPQGAAAQSWLPWTTREEPRRVEPRRQPAPNYGQYRQQAPGGSAGGATGNGGSICLQLEQRLAQDAQNQSGGQQKLQSLKSELATARRDQRRAERELERRECYESFLFTRSLRPSRRCNSLDRRSRQAARRVEELNVEIRSYDSGSSRDRQDEIIRALARNNCGANYQQEARRRDPFTNFWNDNESDSYRGPGNLFGGLPFATYRTVCVRLCDGYYFPVSFSTLPNHFPRDVDVCQSKCAAPTELYFHQNPGGSVEQMVSHRSQQPYTALNTAFRYRKEFVQGCSCKQTEYVPQAQSAAAAPGTATSSSSATAQSRPADKLSPVR